MADAALEAGSDPEKLSFFGLSHWLSEISTLLDRVDEASLEKAPSAEATTLIEQKDDLLEAQSRLRRSMGAQLECPSLTKRERPFAEDFLRQQLSKLEKASTESSKAQRALEKLRQILDEVGSKKAATETREVQDLEIAIKSAEVEWKEVSPIYDKWMKGKHAFKNNDDLQAMKRKYDAAKKARESLPPRLQEALCSSREGKALAAPKKATGPPPGWSSAAKKAPSAGARPAGPPRFKQPAGPNAWGSVMNFAQQMRAQASAQVRNEAEAGGEEEEEQGDDDEEEVPAPAIRPKPKAAPPSVRPKAPPALPTSADDDGFKAVKPGNAARPPAPPVPRRSVEEDDDDEDASPEPRSASYTASAKKKGKAAKKRKGGKGGADDEDDDDVPEPSTEEPRKRVAKPAAAAWISIAEAAISGSLLQELLRPAAWSMPEEEEAEERLEQLTERLPWVNPLGLKLPLEWKEFASLEVDGGPKRTSKRGQSAGLARVQENVAYFLAHYVTILFGVNLMYALSHFGLMFQAVVIQAGFILAPPEVQQKYLRTPTRILVMQGGHMLLWMFFLRSVWQLHVFVKCFVVILVGCHAYVVTPLSQIE